MLEVAQDESHPRLAEEDGAEHLARVAPGARDALSERVLQEPHRGDVEIGERVDAHEIVVGLLGLEGEHREERGSGAPGPDAIECADDEAPTLDVGAPEREGEDVDGGLAA